MQSLCTWNALEFTFILLIALKVCLGEAAGDDQGAVCVKIGEQKIVLGNLSSEKIPQMRVDLVFKNEFVLAHNMKNKSVHFSGYQIYVGDEYPINFYYWC